MVRVIPLLVIIAIGLAGLVVLLVVRSRRREGSRTPDRLGRKDVALLREMFSILVALKTQDDLVPLGIGEPLRERIEGAIRSYSNTPELPQ